MTSNESCSIKRVFTLDILKIWNCILQFVFHSPSHLDHFGRTELIFEVKSLTVVRHFKLENWKWFWRQHNLTYSPYQTIWSSIVENGKRCCYPNEAASIKMLKSWIFIWLAKSKTSGGIWWGHSHSWLQWMLDANPRMGPEGEMLKTNSLPLTTYIEMRSKRRKVCFWSPFRHPTWEPGSRPFSHLEILDIHINQAQLILQLYLKDIESRKIKRAHWQEK